MRAFTLRSPMKKSLPTLHNFLMSSKDGVGPNDACAIPSPDAADILNAPPSLLHTQPLFPSSSSSSSSSFCLTFPPQPFPSLLCCQLSSKPSPHMHFLLFQIDQQKIFMLQTSSIHYPSSTHKPYCGALLLSASHSHLNPYPGPCVSCPRSPALNALLPVSN
jgi:hypothetical protein